MAVRTPKDAHRVSIGKFRLFVYRRWCGRNWCADWTSTSRVSEAWAHAGTATGAAPGAALHTSARPRASRARRWRSGRAAMDGSGQALRYTRGSVGMPGLRNTRVNLRLRNTSRCGLVGKFVEPAKGPAGHSQPGRVLAELKRGR